MLAAVDERTMEVTATLKLPVSRPTSRAAADQPGLALSVVWVRRPPGWRSGGRTRLVIAWRLADDAGRINRPARRLPGRRPAGADGPGPGARTRVGTITRPWHALAWPYTVSLVVAHPL